MLNAQSGSLKQQVNLNHMREANHGSRCPAEPLLPLSSFLNLPNVEPFDLVP